MDGGLSLDGISARGLHISCCGQVWALSYFGRRPGYSHGIELLLYIRSFFCIFLPWLLPVYPRHKRQRWDCWYKPVAKILMEGIPPTSSLECYWPHCVFSIYFFTTQTAGLLFSGAIGSSDFHTLHLLWWNMICNLLLWILCSGGQDCMPCIDKHHLEFNS